MGQFVAVITETNFASVADGNREDAAMLLGTYGPFSSEDEASAFAEKAVAVFEEVNERLTNYSDDIGVKYEITELSLGLPTGGVIESADDVSETVSIVAEPALDAFMRDADTVVVPFEALTRKGKKKFVLTDASLIRAIKDSGQDRFQSVHPTDPRFNAHYYL